MEIDLPQTNISALSVGQNSRYWLKMERLILVNGQNSTERAVKCDRYR